jgi:hypothetical protein
MDTTRIAVDMGLSNIDLVWEDAGGVHMDKLENQYQGVIDQVRQALAVVGDDSVQTCRSV